MSDSSHPPHLLDFHLFPEFQFMCKHKLHKYFDRKPSDWKVVGFLDECDIESFDQKISCYISCLEVLVKNEKELRKERAQLLLDRFRKASVIILLLEILMKVGGVMRSPELLHHSGF
ncbi:hypothetical protein BC938DRAFT_474848 [Jimgerdemannia flammicorona]|uniref:Uncharacterized protein n=1 Tax=Jimgerdemannia flammicorona TaxID=994334 RepID=A0A433Q1J5_9FUNG|nr:hypothetical protein BC938DRAFT_474848 [Jimgerdemannia flammicorona]